MAKRRRRHRKNSSTPKWLPYAIVATGVISLWLWKQAHPGQSLNPTPV